MTRDKVEGARQKEKVPEVAVACRAPRLPCAPDKVSPSGDAALPDRRVHQDSHI